MILLLLILSGLHLAHVPDYVVSQKTGGLGRALLAALTFHIGYLDATGDYLPGNWDILCISAKPVFLFRTLLQHLESRRIVVPGYSFLQDVVSQTLAEERVRLTAVLDGRLSKATVRALDALYVEHDGMYASWASRTTASLTMPRSLITTRYRSCNNCPPAWRASISCAFWGSATGRSTTILSTA
jgi:hypothetical protein